MLGVDYQYIYCKVTGCPHNQKHTPRCGKTGKVTEVYFTCEKEEINLTRNGRCTEASKTWKNRSKRK